MTVMLDSKPPPPNLPVLHKYVTILDAGSTGTRIYVYRYETRGERTIIPLELTLVHDAQTLGSQPLHKQDDLEKVRAHLRPLLESVRELLVNIDASEVPIYLLATQGMRGLKTDESKGILHHVHTVMDEEKSHRLGGGALVTTFKLGSEPDTVHPNRTARVVEGHMEGLLAWVAINHRVEQSKGKPPPPTAAIFEIGGGSMQIAFDDVPSKNTRPHVKDVCLSTGSRNVYTKSWGDFGVESIWERTLESVLPLSKDDDIHIHPCLRRDQTHDEEGKKFVGSDAPDKWEKCLALMRSFLESSNDVAHKARNELFYGLSKPISGTLKGLVPELFVNDWFSSVHYDHEVFKVRSRAWCNSTYPSKDPSDTPGTEMYPILKKRCVSAAWIVSVLEHPGFYTTSNLRDNLYIPTQPEIKARASWTMGAAVLIAQAQNSLEPGLKGCGYHTDGLEVMGIFNGSTDGMEDTFVAPAIQPAFDDESYDEIFTSDTGLIKSSDVPSSAKFIHSLSDNNFITAPLFANFALFAVILVAIGAWVYRRCLRRASPNISLHGDIKL